MKAEDVYLGFEMFCDGSYDVEPQGISNTFQMGVTKLEYDEKENILHVHVRRPGHLIGKSGTNIDKLSKYLDCKVHIHEVTKLWN